MAVALLSRLSGGSDRVTDALPRESGEPGTSDRIDQGFLAAGPVDHGACEEVLLDRYLAESRALELLEVIGELLGVFEDVVERTWHGNHRVNFRRAGIA